MENARLREYVQDRLSGQVRRPDGTPGEGPVTAPWKGRNRPRRQDRGWAMAWSPEQISNRLKVDFPDDESMRVSHEAIYQALYVQSRGALKRELVACLRTGRALRVPRARQRANGHVTPEVTISQRPAEAEDRAVPGHWISTLRSIAARIRFLSTQTADLDAELSALLPQHNAGPALLAEPGVGPVVAAQLLLSWSHRGRVRSEAAFASLAGVAPLEASSGQRIRHRLSRAGDRDLNQALHTVAITRLRCHDESRPTKPNPSPKARRIETSAAASSAPSPHGSTAASKPPPAQPPR